MALIYPPFKVKKVHISTVKNLRIISLLQLQDKEAISLLYDNYSTTLYGVILRIVSSPDIAEDVLQETFVHVWKNGRHYDATKGKLLTWLLNIARNTAINVIRSGGWKMSKRTDDVSGLDCFGEHSIKPEHIDLKELAGKLNPQHRAMIDLVYFQGYTHQEIEKEFNMPLATIKTQLRAAVLGLRNVLGDKPMPIRANEVS